MPSPVQCLVCLQSPVRSGLRGRTSAVWKSWLVLMCAVCDQKLAVLVKMPLKVANKRKVSLLVNNSDHCASICRQLQLPTKKSVGNRRRHQCTSSIDEATRPCLLLPYVQAYRPWAVALEHIQHCFLLITTSYCREAAE